MRRSRNAESEMFWIIVFALVAIAVGFIILVFSKGGIEKAFGGIGSQLDNLEDYDGDKVANMFDKCPCTPAGNDADEELQGCARGTTAEAAGADQDLFQEKGCAGK